MTRAESQRVEPGHYVNRDDDPTPRLVVRVRHTMTSLGSIIELEGMAEGDGFGRMNCTDWHRCDEHGCRL